MRGNLVRRRDVSSYSVVWICVEHGCGTVTQSRSKSSTLRPKQNPDIMSSLNLRCEAQRHDLGMCLLNPVISTHSIPVTSTSIVIRRSSQQQPAGPLMMRSPPAPLPLSLDVHLPRETPPSTMVGCVPVDELTGRLKRPPCGAGGPAFTKAKSSPHSSAKKGSPWLSFQFDERARRSFVAKRKMRISWLLPLFLLAWPQGGSSIAATMSISYS